MSATEEEPTTGSKRKSEASDIRAKKSKTTKSFARPAARLLLDRLDLKKEVAASSTVEAAVACATFAAAEVILDSLDRLETPPCTCEPKCPKSDVCRPAETVGTVLSEKPCCSSCADCDCSKCPHLRGCQVAVADPTEKAISHRPETKLHLEKGDQPYKLEESWRIMRLLVVVQSFPFASRMYIKGIGLDFGNCSGADQEKVQRFFLAMNQCPLGQRIRNHVATRVTGCKPKASTPAKEWSEENFHGDEEQYKVFSHVLKHFDLSDAAAPLLYGLMVKAYGGRADVMSRCLANSMEDPGILASTSSATVFDQIFPEELVVAGIAAGSDAVGGGALAQPSSASDLISDHRGVKLIKVAVSAMAKGVVADYLGRSVQQAIYNVIDTPVAVALLFITAGGLRNAGSKKFVVSHTTLGAVALHNAGPSWSVGLLPEDAPATHVTEPVRTGEGVDIGSGSVVVIKRDSGAALLEQACALHSAGAAAVIFLVDETDLAKPEAGGTRVPIPVFKIGQVQGDQLASAIETDPNVTLTASPPLFEKHAELVDHAYTDSRVPKDGCTMNTHHRGQRRARTLKVFVETSPLLDETLAALYTSKEFPCITNTYEADLSAFKTELGLQSGKVAEVAPHDALAKPGDHVEFVASLKGRSRQRRRGQALQSVSNSQSNIGGGSSDPPSE